MSTANDDTHLLRVRVKNSIYNELKEMMEAESRRVGDTVTVSDLARTALVNLLNAHRSRHKLLRASELQGDLLILLTAPRFQPSSEEDAEGYEDLS